MCLRGLFLPVERLSCSSRLSVDATLDGRHLPVANHLAGMPVQHCQRRLRVKWNSAGDGGETSSITLFLVFFSRGKKKSDEKQPHLHRK